jgi:hypothetical protein
LLASSLVGLAEGEGDSLIVRTYFDEIAENLNAIDPDHPVYRDDPNSWRVGQERYTSFEQAILEKLEWLIGLYYG